MLEDLGQAQLANAIFGGVVDVMRLVLPWNRL